MAALQRRGEMRRKNERREKKDGGCPDQKVKWLKRKGAWEREGGREEREGRGGRREGRREGGREGEREEKGNNHLQVRASQGSSPSHEVLPHD